MLETLDGKAKTEQGFLERRDGSEQSVVSFEESRAKTRSGELSLFRGIENLEFTKLFDNLCVSQSCQTNTRLPAYPSGNIVSDRAWANQDQ